MVSIALKTLFLFLALVALPRVLAGETTDEMLRKSHELKDETLDNHNIGRALYKVPPLSWNPSLVSLALAQGLACAPGQLKSTFGNFGVNGAIASSVTDATRLWYKEAKLFDTKSTNNAYTNFTQIIWRNTKQVGCAIAQCGPGTLDPHNTVSFVTCLYSPPGNIPGRFPDQEY